MPCKTQINRKTILENKALSRHLGAAIPLRSAEAELQNTKAQRQQRREKVTWNLRLLSRMRANFSPQRNLRKPGKHNVLRKSEHSKHVIHVAVPMPRMTCKTQINRKTILENKHLSRHLDAAIPPRSAETKLQNTIAQRQQRRGKVTWNNAQSHCACKSSRIRRQSDDALDVQLV
jgi:hypothetical protein